MKKTIIIGQSVFTVRKAIEGNESTRNHVNHESIYTAYGKPSIYKVEIWNDWQAELLHNGAYNVGINSKNAHMFTISFTIEIDSIRYIGYISRTRQELTPINMTV